MATLWSSSCSSTPNSPIEIDSICITGPLLDDGSPYSAIGEVELRLSYLITSKSHSTNLFTIIRFHSRFTLTENMELETMPVNLVPFSDLSAFTLNLTLAELSIFVIFYSPDRANGSLEKLMLKSNFIHIVHHAI